MERVTWQMQETGIKRDMNDVQRKWKDIQNDDDDEVVCQGEVSAEEARKRDDAKIPVVDLTLSDDEK